MTVRLLAVLLGATTLACAGVSAARAPAAVAVMGSSTAAGAGASAGNGWVNRVRKAATAACPYVTVSNLAVSGSNTWQGLANLDAALALKPVLVLVQYPSNDAASLSPWRTRWPTSPPFATGSARREPPPSSWAPSRGASPTRSGWRS